MALTHGKNCLPILKTGKLFPRVTCENYGSSSLGFKFIYYDFVSTTNLAMHLASWAKQQSHSPEARVQINFCWAGNFLNSRLVILDVE
jgi:hypothetical protein